MARIASDAKKNIRYAGRFFPILFVLLAAISMMLYSSLPLFGRWLVREDLIYPADAIAVLSGNFPQRAEEAAGLYLSGYAPEIWLTHPVSRSLAPQAGQSPLSGEDARNFEVLLNSGVPAEASRVLDTPIVNTADELNAIDSGLKRYGDNSVIVVTGKAHTRRVFSLWDKYHFRDGRILLHAVSDDEFSPSRWWKTRSSRTQAMHELLGMIDLWAGLPIHRPLQEIPNGN